MAACIRCWSAHASRCSTSRRSPTRCVVACACVCVRVCMCAGAMPAFVVVWARARARCWAAPGQSTDTHGALRHNHTHTHTHAHTHAHTHTHAHATPAVHGVPQLGAAAGDAARRRERHDVPAQAPLRARRPAQPKPLRGGRRSGEAACVCAGGRGGEWGAASPAGARCALGAGAQQE
jgi:hypothetical protein